MDDIRDRRLAVGDKLPNEYELAEQFAVSRATVREAIQGLLETGHLARQRGNGTFVAPTPSRHALDSNVSYTAMIREAGHEPSETVLNTLFRAPTPSEAERLGLGLEDRLVEVERIRFSQHGLRSRRRITGKLVAVCNANSRRSLPSDTLGAAPVRLSR